MLHRVWVTAGVSTLRLKHPYQATVRRFAIAAFEDVREDALGVIRRSWTVSQAGFHHYHRPEALCYNISTERCIQTSNSYRTEQKMEAFETLEGCANALGQSSSKEDEKTKDIEMKDDNILNKADTKANKGAEDEEDISEMDDSVVKVENKSRDADDTGIYRYIKDDLFTSEIFKVEIQNLPKYTSFNDLKKFLAKYGLNPHKIKLIQKQTFAFVTFKSEEERDKAMKVIHGTMWKNRALSVRLAKPKADPIMKKRKQEEDEKDQPKSKRPAADEGVEEEPLSKQIADVVTPLWQVPYEEQLKMKEKECDQVLQKLTKEIGNTNKALLPWLFVQKQKYNKVCCPLEGVRPSPTQTEYRNKSEFLIGVGANQEDKTVGFRLGKYKGGTCAVVEPFDTIHIPHAVKKVVMAFQQYIRSSPYAIYSPESYEGHWKQLTVRSSRKGQVMAIVYFNPQKLSKESLADLKSSLATFFSDGPGKDSGITSLYFVQEGQRKSPNLEDLPVEHVSGEEYIHEELLGLTFRISPHAFFQVNTLAAEVLYSTIADWAQLNENSTVLDVCCGTGTIGLSLAKRVKKVIGIELCQEAIADAKVNAQINNLSNVEYRCGKAEDIFPTLINTLVTQNPVAIVDPPRAGLHSKVIIAVRRAEHLKQLIYVACNPKAAFNNFIDLCRAPSNRVKGRPFRPVRAIAVDLFPQTPHCELLILFERVEYTENTTNATNSTSKPSSENVETEAGKIGIEATTDSTSKHSSENVETEAGKIGVEATTDSTSKPSSENVETEASKIGVEATTGSTSKHSSENVETKAGKIGVDAAIDSTAEPSCEDVEPEAGKIGIKATDSTAKP